MSDKTALLTFSIGPVHGFITQARRISDFWAGSDLLSRLVGKAVQSAFESGAQMLFPHIESGHAMPPGLPNRFVCRVPLERAADYAVAMEKAVRDEWARLVREAIVTLEKYQLAKKGGAVDPLEVAWCWVPEGGDYAKSSEAGARQFAASRAFRPFRQTGEEGEKCRLCGERTALPDGGRDSVRKAWQEAETRSAGSDDAPYFRFKQGCLCLVCATKRLSGRVREFSALDRFQPVDDRGEEKGEPYYALVCMDGDKMGRTLGTDAAKLKGADLEGFHREVSETLIRFADGLRNPAGADLRLDGLNVRPRGRHPQLIYAGGEDVVFICDPRDALPLAKAIRERYRAMFKGVAEKCFKDGVEGWKRFTLSAGILFVHVKHPAGLAFRDAEELLKRKAKREEGRDAVALRLDKRGGAPTEVAFRWEEASGADGKPWVQRFTALVEHLAGDTLSSKQSYNLTQEVDTLGGTLETENDWGKWLALSLSRGGTGKERGRDLATLVAPFFVHKKTEALRIARFLGVELGGSKGGAL
jgi:hypothetical protein